MVVRVCWTAVAVSGAAARNFRSSGSHSPEQQSAASEAATRNFPSEAALCAPRRRRGLPPAFLRGRKVASSSQRFAGLRTRAVVRSLLAASPPSEQNREPPPPHKEKPAKRYKHLAGLREEDAAESNRAESTQADSNSAAENATRGPRCGVFFPGWQKTRLWGPSGRLEVTGKARKRAAKREKRQESRQ